MATIRPLPPDVAAQLKSSTAVVSLGGVVVELLANALDAGATRIEATVDFGRGGCVVEDDGLGIAPLEFREEGGLGKRYHTSKYLADIACFGRHGTFLASLAAVSLLTITSHHHEHRSLNSLTIHHSRLVERQLPAQPGREIQYEHHGTRVTVRNLFGNLPVRVKQRAVSVEQKTEHQRLWLALKRGITALVLTCQRPVSLRVRDAAHATVLKFRNQVHRTAAAPEHGPGGRRSYSGLQVLLDTLSQAGFITVEDWPSWVPVSASTQNVSIKGAISLDPAPTKSVQFISLGARPLASDAGGNELYEQVNRIFGLSSFGIVEEEGSIGEDEKIRRTNDKRFKSDGYTNKQLKGRKGVDRHPMFYLRISFKDRIERQVPPDQLLAKETTLQAVLGVLDAMLSQWLAVHHFRPRTIRPKTSRPATAPAEGSSESETSVRDRPDGSKVAMTTSLRSRSAVLGERKRKLQDTETEKNMSRSNISSFHGWSRIKSGKSEFYDSIWSSGKTGCGSPLQQALHECDFEKASAPPHSSHDVTTFNMPTIPRGSLCALTAHSEPAEEQSTFSQPLEPSPVPNEDEIVRWIDPSTKQVHLLDARTGCIVPESALQDTQLPSTSSANGFRKPGKSLRIQTTARKNEQSSNTWLNGILEQWDNPVFQPVEMRIPQIPIVEHYGNQDSQHGLGRPKRSNIQPDENVDVDNLTKAVARFSRDDLRKANVLAQLDKKFILIKMPCSNDGKGGVLVLIDQHAADERVRVEALLTELCTPLPESEGLYVSSLGCPSQVAFAILDTPLNFSIPVRESELFAAYAAHFAAWGILFDLIPAKERPTTADTTSAIPLLSVTALPACISERCKADPKLLISFLRSTMWEYADSTIKPLPPQHLSEWAHDDSTPLWLRRLSSCPQGLVDLVNSRACRSAIMFNDDLSIPECEQLVAKLSKCTFPFMCAHGRPSMIPLVNLGAEGTVGDALGLVPEYLPNSERQLNFVAAWKTWRSRSSTAST